MLMIKCGEVCKGIPNDVNVIIVQIAQKKCRFELSAIRCDQKWIDIVRM